VIIPDTEQVMRTATWTPLGTAKAIVPTKSS
jgi:hypothetical protein